MPCENCDPKDNKPGGYIKVTADLKNCLICGSSLAQIRWDYEKDSLPNIHSKWDTYFLDICHSVASKSPCLSRKIGAILVRDHSIISTGYNGPPRGVPHCGHERFIKDTLLNSLIESETSILTEFKNTCPRRVLGHESGTHMELCPAQHAETNAISNAARLGVSILGSTLYMNSVIPCKNCFGALINAGIVEVVVSDAKPYDVHTAFIMDSSNIKLKEFER